MVAPHAVLTAALLATVPVVAPGLAAAQDAPARLEVARTEFERGLALAEQQRWAEALASFERSRAAADRPSAAFNAALALQHLGRVIDARRALETCLAMPDTASDPELTRDAVAVLTTVRAAIATVTLAVTPERAELRVDGAPTGATGAARTLELDPGSHVLNAAAPGFVSEDFTLRLSPGERASRAVTLAPQLARLSVVALPADATVLIDGAVSGRGEASWEGPARRVEVRVTAEGHVASQRTVGLEAGEHARLAVSLTRAPRPVTANPWLWVGVGAGVAAVATVLVLVLVHPTAEPDAGTSGRVLSGGP